MLRWSECAQSEVLALVTRYQLNLEQVLDGQPIPGSYWGDDEAGLINGTVYIRDDTPLHSLLHEACHAICMGAERRKVLNTDAGGDDSEENAVCYLQLLLAEQITGFGLQRCCADMDAWGYSFRLGSAQRWFLEDATEAQEWLRSRGLITQQDAPSPEPQC
ncbi:MAG: hypothetical protein ACSHXK_02740 [Oceanococcus sp.]